ncbi:MAG: helix-turn-helix transcriptional regulator [Alphaproteobacteria bacterium]|nr:helix-turn-helix transcriptional regulator [Alphaproteobacteria bacterium]
MKNAQNPQYFTTSGDIALSLNDSYHILQTVRNGKIIYLPLYILTFPMGQYYKTVEANVFMNNNPDPEKLKTTAEKLRWFRYKNRMLQIEVAQAIEIDRSTYINNEKVEHRAYPHENLKLIAKLYSIDFIDLLDEYNMFLYNGQGKQIQAIRKSMNLNRDKFATLFGVKHKTIENWENETVTVSKKTWIKLFNL